MGNTGDWCMVAGVFSGVFALFAFTDRAWKAGSVAAVLCFLNIACYFWLS